YKSEYEEGQFSKTRLRRLVSRKDININAKQGVKRVEPYLLNSIDVSYKTQKIRSYKSEYEEGQFSKTRLRRLVSRKDININAKQGVK
ncbi:hypothetical protein, partial [Chryseobacterium sp. CH1]|uniref:hypothetical protein n=1 Tax=Chryseobacterium sp. CH1 TaxID=713551 RepID=UPI0010254855